MASIKVDNRGSFGSKRSRNDGSQAHSLLVDDIFDRYFNYEIDDFEKFHICFLDFYNKLNSRLPGRYYVAASFDELKNCYEEWKSTSNDAERKQLLAKFMKEHIHISETHEDAILMVGLMAPPAAIIIKRMVPDVIFVPFFTLMAIIAVVTKQGHK